MDMMPDGDRYARMPLRRTGRSGLMLPAMSLMINRRPLPEDRVWTEMRRAGCRFHKPSGSGTVKASTWEAAIPLPGRGLRKRRPRGSEAHRLDHDEIGRPDAGQLARAGSPVEWARRCGMLHQL